MTGSNLIVPAERDKSRVLRLQQALAGAHANLRVLVVGDCMLDRYILGDVCRISPEAPVPVVAKMQESTQPGGAANVALNLAGFGADVSLVGIVGEDESGRQLVDGLAKSRLKTDYLFRTEEINTTMKTRVVAGNQHILRVDEDPREEVSEIAASQLVSLVTRALCEQPSAVLLSDYRKGVLSDSVCPEIIRQSRQRDIPVFVDPKGADYGRYAGADVITPNISELALVTGGPHDDFDALIRAGRKLIRSLGIGKLVVTRGPDGLSLVDSADVVHFPAHAQEVFDVTGAGDTVVAAICMARSLGLAWQDALHVANVSAGLVVRHRGTYAVQLSEVVSAMEFPFNNLDCTILSHAELGEMVDQWRSNGDRIVFTNGCFDILHVGHLKCLECAAAAGDRLVVAINSDVSVRKLKGDGRPINTEQDRARVIAALKHVDAVTLFDDTTPIRLVEQLRPDVLVKGADYFGKQIVGAREVESWGGRVVLAPLSTGHSTTAHAERLQQ